MTSYLFKSYYCDLRKIAFDHPEEHSCVTVCKACQRILCRPDSNKNVKIMIYLFKINHFLIFMTNQNAKLPKYVLNACTLYHAGVLIYAVMIKNGVPIVMNQSIHK